MLDYEDGLTKYHRDDQWRLGVETHYEQNLRTMIRLAGDAGVPVLLANPVSNVHGTPPFKVEHDSQLTPKQLAEFQSRWKAAKQCAWDDLDVKLEKVNASLEIDPRHAEALFLLGRVRESRGEIPRAREAYLRAKDEDICPLRMTESMHQAVMRVAAQTGTPMVDVRADFEKRAENGLPGDDQLIDHVHPRIEGHQRIAELLFEQMIESRMVTPIGGWQAQREERFNRNFALLPHNYFPQALSRLEGLNRWARGRLGELGQTEDAD